MPRFRCQLKQTVPSRLNLWFKSCTRRTVVQISNLRDHGLTWREIAQHFEISQDTASRYYRAYQQFGPERFALD